MRKLHDGKNKFSFGNMVFLGYELCPVLLAHEFGRDSDLLFRDPELEFCGLVRSVCGDRVTVCKPLFPDIRAVTQSGLWTGSSFLV